MSNPRYQWWGYVKWVIRDYPAKYKELRSMRQQSMTPNYSGMPGSYEPQRGAENVALRELTGQKRREYDAVENAICATKTRADGNERLQMVDRVFWAQTHTLQGAALAGHVSYETAVNWHRDFIKEVAANMGLLDE